MSDISVGMRATMKGSRVSLMRSILWTGLVGAAVLAAACGSEALTNAQPPQDEAVQSGGVAPPETAELPTPTVVAPSPTAAPSPTPTAAPGPTPTATPVPGPPLEAVPVGQVLDLIAYTDRLGRVMVSGPDGADVRRIDPDAGFYSWPNWSPSGDRIVFSGVPGQAGEPLKLYTYQLGDDGARVVFANQPGAGPIYPDMPHYPLWSPDGQRLALVASLDRRLTLFLADLSYGDTPDVVIQLPEVYLSWSEDSRRIVVHGSGDHFLIDVGIKTVTLLDDWAPGYRVPAWWPGGDRYAVVSEGRDGSRGLFVVDVGTGSRTRVESVPGEAAFLWSPDGRTLAVAQSSPQTGLSFQSVGLFLPDGSKMDTEIREDVIAFYWAPDSTKLAYVTFGDAPGVVRWKVLDLSDGTRMTLADFTPSVSQLIQFQFFDQFAHSHTTWSPGSDALVFAGKLGATGPSEGDVVTSQIIVARFQPVPSVRPIADGVVAFWSPR